MSRAAVDKCPVDKDIDSVDIGSRNWWNTPDNISEKGADGKNSQHRANDKPIYGDLQG
jgi:hypothetical protein